MTLRLAWAMLPDQRPYRELHWLSLMPDAEVTAIGGREPPERVAFVHRPYRRLTERFVEAAALAWIRDLETVEPSFRWVASLELCSLVTAQVRRYARRRNLLQAVLTWGNDPRNPLYRLPPYSLALRESRRADLFLCLIAAAKDHCVALGIDEERCEVVHPGIDTATFHPPDRSVEEPVALFASPLYENKGIDRVLHAFELVRRELPEARLRVVGSGPMEGMVRAAAERSGGAIAFAGALPQRGVAAEMRNAAVFVTAPRPTRVWNEQFGLAYLEAMASGMCVVTTVCGTNYEAVRPPNLRVPDDAGALADAMLHFLRDPSLRARVGGANRSYVEEHHEVRRQSERMRAAFAAHGG